MKLLNFYRLSVFTSIMFLVLAMILLFAPAQMLTGWGVELTASTGLLTKRIAGLYMGVAVMFFVARSAPISITRTALIYGIITSCLLLAAFGVYEFASGHAKSDILAAFLIESMLALAFIFVHTRQK